MRWLNWRKWDFLVKPHTSAGRMPSDKGYRAYVDNLLSLPEIPPEEEIAVRQFLTEKP